MLIELPFELVAKTSPVRVEAIIWAAARAAHLDADTNQRKPATSFIRECEIFTGERIGVARLLALPGERTSAKIQPCDGVKAEDLDRLKQFCQRLVDDLTKQRLLATED